MNQTGRMKQQLFFLFLAIGLVGLCFAAKALAGGLLANRANKILIEGQFSNAQQEFLLIFSAKPLCDERGRLIDRLSETEVSSFRNNSDQMLVRVFGKQAAKPGLFEFSFGPGEDQDRQWNNGRELSWQRWANVSPDLWDNLCILTPAVPRGRSVFATITNVAVIKGDKLLFDSRKRESFPNKQRVNAGFPRFNALPKGGELPVLNLSAFMSKFRREFYELGDNPYLTTAYADLGQTDKSKYANRGSNWCSEFASWVYRQNGLMTPDPNRSDVHFRSMREFFERQGRVYTMREVAAWSDQEKLARIKPGTFVSILIGKSTHSLIFTAWVRNTKGPISAYTAISGNNQGMVWPHSPLKLPAVESLQRMSAAELTEFDAKVYFAVPEDRK
jgi:hypothetical protein